MKTIWLVNPYGPIEGEKWREYSFNQFGKYLSQNGYNVIWWTASFSHHFKYQRSDGYKDIVVNENFSIRLVPTTGYKKNLGFGRMWKDVVFACNAYKNFKSQQSPTMIIANENPLVLGYPAFKYAKRHSVPIVYDQMDIWPEFIVKVLRQPLSRIANFFFKPVYSARRKIYGQLSGAIALGKHYLEFMQSVNPILSEKPCALVYNGIDVNEFRSHLKEPIKNKKIANLKKSEPWAIFAGTLGPSYDIPTLIHCAEMCDKDKANSIKFLIAGSGPYEALVKEAEERLNNVVYLGKLLPEELIPIYGRCDIGLNAYSAGSNVDMPDKFYDYTAAGLAVINSLTGEVSEHISQRGVGVNYTAENSDSMFAAMQQLLTGDALAACRKHSFEVGIDFDKDVQNQKLQDVIEQILAMKETQ